MNQPNVLVIDDDQDILKLFQRILDPPPKKKRNAELENIARDLLDVTGAPPLKHLNVLTANQGKEGIRIVRESLENNDPISVAFIDMHMPPGIDGLETAKLILEVDPRIGIVFVTAFANTSKEAVYDAMRRHHFFYIQKPFDALEVRQMADSLVFRWETAREREQLDREKESFISNITHDLKNPLQVIMGICDTLLNCKMDRERMEQFVHDIEGEARKLNSLTGKLKLLKENEKATSLKLVPFDLSKLIHSVVHHLKREAEKKGLELIIQEKHKQNLAIGDSDQLFQVMVNLVVNAIHYTLKGSIQIIIEEVCNELRISVQDTGIGIVEEEQELIFQKFFRSRQQIVLYRGDGVGLTTAQEIIRQHGGRIHVNSKLGEGSCFFFFLRYIPVEAEKRD